MKVIIDTWQPKVQLQPLYLTHFEAFEEMKTETVFELYK